MADMSAPLHFMADMWAPYDGFLAFRLGMQSAIDNIVMEKALIIPIYILWC